MGADGGGPSDCDELICTNVREVVDAPSPEAIWIAAQATALPVDRITEVRVCDPTSL